MRNVVEQTTDIKLQDPRITPTPLLSDPYSLDRRFSWAIAVGIWKKARLDLGFKLELDHHLGDSIRYRWYSQNPLPARFLRDGNGTNRWRHIAARRHPVPDFIKIILSITVKVLQ